VNGWRAHRLRDEFPGARPADLDGGARRCLWFCGGRPLAIAVIWISHMNLQRLTIVYDGMCHLCSGSIVWIAQRVPPDRVQFTPVQSAEGAQALRAAGLNTLDPESFLFINNEECLVKSAAVIGALDIIGGRWKVIAWLLNLLPASFTDKIYDWVAANRYKWFGRRETCFIRR
jgi:predicted DCC family thiol-disulfide oxidoreductase YuxK